MVAVIETPKTTSLRAVKRAVNFALDEEVAITLSNVSWKTYTQLLQDLGERPNPRFYFEKGKLLIMPLSAEHEAIKDTIVYLINVLTEEFSVNARSLGSATYQKEDIEQGFEPDSCFYFANEPKIRGVKRLDMTVHPAPDLIIEVDITSLSTNRQSIFAAFAVPEIWRFENEKLEFLRLKGKKYVSVTKSLALPLASANKLTEFIAENDKLDRLEWLKQVREWACQVKLETQT